MAYYFFKALLAITRPFTVVLILMLCSLISLRRQKLQVGKRLLTLALSLLILSSLPIAANFLMSSLERQFRSIKASEAPRVQAIVVLGGTVSNSLPPRSEPDEAYGTRLTSAYRLYQEKKAPLILVSSGSSYRPSCGPLRYESSDMKDYLLNLTVPAEAIIEEDQSRNTQENFNYTQKILQEREIKRIILVTSAYHMPRAMKWFSKAGIDITAFPTEFRVSEGPFRFHTLVPSLSALNDFTTALKEHLGLLAFSLFS